MYVKLTVCWCAGLLAEAHQDVLNAESVPGDIKEQAERLRTAYLQEALARMVLADHEYRKTCKKVEETDVDLAQLSVDTLLSGVSIDCYKHGKAQ